MEQFDPPLLEEQHSDPEVNDRERRVPTISETEVRAGRLDIPPAQPATGGVGGVTAGAVALRRPWMLLIPALLLAGVGIALALVRKPEFTATDHATLQISSSDSTALGGISEVTPTEAASVSRAVTSDSIVDPIARRFDLSHKAVLADVTATPVPQSGDLSFTATARSSALALGLANAVTQATKQYVGSRLNAGTEAPAVLTQYQAALAQLSALQANPKMKGSPAEQAATTRVAGLKLKYQDDLTAPTFSLVAFDTATAASSDRRSRIELYGIIGLVAGLVGGFALCALRARRLTLPPRSR